MFYVFINENNIRWKKRDGLEEQNSTGKIDILQE